MSDRPPIRRRAVLHRGDMRNVLAEYPDNHFDALVTDPPYGLSRAPDMAEVLRHWLAGDDYRNPSGGFMGKAWDSFVPGPNMWREVWRVMKPGAHGLVFCGTRTMDLMGTSLRLAGFEVRDTLMWMYGTGFPKSMDVAKAIQKSMRGDEATPWNGWGTALKPAVEPIILVRKPFKGSVAENVLEWKTGGLNIDASRISVGNETIHTPQSNPANRQGDVGADLGFTQNSKEKFQDAQRESVVRTMEKGRWPANVILDSEVAGMLDAQTGNSGGASRFFYVTKASKGEREAGLDDFPTQLFSQSVGGQSAIRAGKGERGYQQDTDSHPDTPGINKIKARKNAHPTVKPISLMRYLVNLVTPPKGIILDPFIGSGATGIAAVVEGFYVVGVDLCEDGPWIDIAEARIRYWREKLGIKGATRRKGKK